MRLRPLLRRAARFWEVPFLAIVAFLMFRWRMASYSLNVHPDSFPHRVFYMGTDPYYHLRAVVVAVENFPSALRWDPWTFFPRGTFTGQFGTLFDQVLAAAILLVTGGEPTRAFIEEALAVYPAVLGALSVVPVYFLARRMFGNPGAAWTAVVLALLPGSFFTRSVAAHADHHVAEALTSALAVLAVLVAVERARNAEEIFHRFRDAEVRGRLLRLLGWGLLGALGFAVYFWTWTPAVLFAAILTAALALVVALDHARGKTSRGVAFATAVSFLGAALLVLPLRETNGFEVTFFTWTQPVTLALGAAFVGGLAWTSERARGRLPGYAFLGVVAAAGAGVAGAVALLSREYWAVVRGGFQWVTGVGYSGGGRTISEARAPVDPDQFATTGEYLRALDDFFFTEYGFVYYGALAGLALLLVAVARRPGPSNAVLLVWSAFMVVAGFSQLRFHYYLAVNVALLNGFALAEVVRITKAREAWSNTFERAAEPAKGRRARRAEKLGWKQPAAVAAVVFLVLPGNVFVYEGGDRCRGEFRPAWAIGQCLGPDREIQFWSDGLDWLREHTPSPGLEVKALPDRATFRYPPEAYGVLSWWDYGHWTEILGERPPVANPFQQAAPFAARWFTTSDPAEADRLLDEWSPDLPVRYVLIDDASAFSKFPAIALWARFDGFDLGETAAFESDRGSLDLPVYGAAYGRTMMSRLYRDDAEGLGTYRLVHEERMTTLVGNRIDLERGRILGYGAILDWGSPESMEKEYGSLNYRSDGLVCEGRTTEDGRCPSGRFAYELEVHSALKVFERVEGARVRGEGAPGSSVRALLILTAENTGRTIDAEMRTTVGSDGAWELRLPYPTQGFLGLDAGGTDADVVPARSKWVIEVGESILLASPSETAVLKGLDVPLE